MGEDFDCLDEVLEIDRNLAWHLLAEEFNTIGLFCPHCNHELSGYTLPSNFHIMRLGFCGTCNEQFDPKMITPFGDTDWKPEDLVKVIILSCIYNESSGKIGAMLSRTPEEVVAIIDRVNEWGRITAALKHQTAGVK